MTRTYCQIAQSTLDAVCVCAPLSSRQRGVDCCDVEQHARALVGERRKRDWSVRRDAVWRREWQAVGKLQSNLRVSQPTPATHIRWKLGGHKCQLGIVPSQSASVVAIYCSTTHFISPLATSGCASTFGSTHSRLMSTSLSTSRRKASGCASRKWPPMYDRRSEAYASSFSACLLGTARKLDCHQHFDLTV